MISRLAFLRRLPPTIVGVLAVASLAATAAAAPGANQPPAVAPVPPPAASSPGTPAPAAAAAPGRVVQVVGSATPEQVAAVTRFVSEWAQAWQRQEPAAYLALYADDAVVEQRDRAAFEAHKRRLFAVGGVIDVGVGDLVVERVRSSGEDLLRARFHQEYSSSRLSDFGRKELLLREAGGLRIVRETFRAEAGRIERPLGEASAATPARPTPPAGTGEPLLGGEYAPPADVTPEPPKAGDDVLRMEPLLGPGPPVRATGWGLPSDQGERRVVEEIVATVNGEILTRSMLVKRIGWYESTLLEQDPPDLDDQLSHLAASTLDATIKRWLILQEARSRSADVEGFWREWLAQFRRQVGAEDLDALESLLKDQGTTMAELREQVVETEVPNLFLQQQIGAELTFTEEELKGWFESHAVTYQKSQEVTLRQILIPLSGGDDPARALAAAEAATAALRDGKDWCDVHDVYGPGDAGCGEVGTLRVDDLLPELRDAARGLPVGAVSRPVRSTQGVHVLQVTARQGFDPVEFSVVREDVLRDMRLHAFEEKTDAYVVDLRSRAQIDVNPRYPRIDAPAAAAGTGGVSQ